MHFSIGFPCFYQVSLQRKFSTYGRHSRFSMFHLYEFKHDKSTQCKKKLYIQHGQEGSFLLIQRHIYIQIMDKCFWKCPLQRWQFYQYQTCTTIQRQAKPPKIKWSHGKNSVFYFLSHIRKHFFKTYSKKQKQVKPLNLV